MKAQFKIISLLMSLLIFSVPIIHAEELNLVYDGNGNLVAGDGFYREYNAFNQLWKIYNGSDSSGILLQELIHDPEEERILVKKLFNESGHNYETVYYPAQHYVRVVNASGTYDTLYVYHNGQLIAEKRQDGSKIYHHTDHLGSTTLISDESGNEVETTEYSPYGLILSNGGTSRYDYEGKEFDSLLGDYDFHFRKYCARWGKFCNPDTLIPNLYNPQSLNRYSFELGNPYGRTDPTGHLAPLVATGLVIFGIGFTVGAVSEGIVQYRQKDFNLARLLGKGTEKGVTLVVVAAAVSAATVTGTTAGAVVASGILIAEEVSDMTDLAEVASTETAERTSGPEIKIEEEFLELSEEDLKKIKKDDGTTIELPQQSIDLQIENKGEKKSSISGGKGGASSYVKKTSRGTYVCSRCDNRGFRKRTASSKTKTSTRN